jgi:hypothetical protein
MRNLLIIFLGLLIVSFSVVGFSAEMDTKEEVEKAIEKASEEAAEKAVEKVTEKTVERAAEKAAEKAVEIATEKSVGEAVEKAVEKVAEEAAEKASEDAAEKAALTAKRPDEWRGPTKVKLFVFVLDVDDVDDAAQNFTTNFYVRLRWHDDRLINQHDSPRQVPLEEVWNPQVLLANRVGLVSRSLPEVVQVFPNGNVMYQQRYTGKLSQPLKLSDFPMDKHTFAIQFAAAGYTADELEFIPDKTKNNVSGGGIADVLSVPDWEIAEFEAVSSPYQPIPEISSAGFVFRFEARRYISYYLWQIVLPLTVVVVMSWVAFWVNRHEVGVRIGVATSSILTLIAHRFILANLLPRLPYMTRLDYFTVGSTLLVFMALIVVVMTSFLAKRDYHDNKARMINVSSRFVFPAAFFVLLGWFVAG